MQPTAKSLVLDLLSTLRGRALPVRGLVATGAIFGIAGNSIRVELARLTARGLVARDERGRYRLAAAAEAVQSRVAAWAELDERVVEWRGGWIAACTAARSRGDRAAGRRRQRVLDFLGFRELAPGLWIRPDNLRGGVAEGRRQLGAFGVGDDVLVGALTDLDPATERRARGLWDVEALVAGYRATRRALAASERRLGALTVEAAMVETFLVGGSAIRQLARDPLLPEPILRTAERRALVAAARRYDRRGRQCWRPFMRAHRAPSGRSPVNLRMVSAAGDLPAVAGSHG